jgi:hypothetical protein
MSPFGIGVEIAREEIELKMIAEATGIASTSLTPETGLATALATGSSPPANSLSGPKPDGRHCERVRKLKHKMVQHSNRGTTMLDPAMDFEEGNERRFG